MKRLVTLALILSLVCLPCPRAKAPTVSEAGFAICIGAVVLSIGVAYVIHCCDPKYVLAWSQEEGEPKRFVCTSANAAARRASGLTDCEGPFGKLPECEAVARIGNTNAALVACGPLGNVGGAARRVKLHASADQKGWTERASQSVAAGDNWSFALVPAGILTESDQTLLGGAATVVNDGSAVQFFRVQVEAPDGAN